MKSLISKVLKRENALTEAASSLVRKYREETHQIRNRARTFCVIPFWNMHNHMDMLTELPQGEWVTDNYDISMFYVGRDNQSTKILIRADGDLPPVYTDKHTRTIWVVEGILIDTETKKKYCHKDVLTIGKGDAKRLTLHGTIAVIFVPPVETKTRETNGHTI